MPHITTPTGDGMNAVRTALGTARSRNANGREGTSTVSPQTSRFMEAGSARRCGAQVRLVLSGTETGIAYRLSCPRASHSSAAEASNVPGSLGESLNSEIQLEESLPEKAMLILFAHKMAEQVQGKNTVLFELLILTVHSQLVASMVSAERN